MVSNYSGEYDMSNKMKNMLLLLVIVIITFTGVGVILHFYQNDNDLKLLARPQADWVSHYETIDALVENSDIIILGEKHGSYTEQRISMIFTKELIQIEEVYKGEEIIDDEIVDNEIIGEEIEILQTGGEMNNITTLPFAEAPLLEEDIEYLLFLDKTSEGYYLIMGGYQGVGTIVNGNVLFSDANIEIANSVENNSLEELEIMLRGYVSYTFNSEYGGFEVTAPKEWEYDEYSFTKASSEYEASPDGGLQFKLDEDLLISVSVTLARFYYRDPFIEDIETEDGFIAKAYSNSDNKYITTVEFTDTLSVNINCSDEVYLENKDAIYDLIKSIKIIHP